ncbi:MAG: prepilin peptidase [Propionibacteriaceae bacterium]|jgi:leader peptidase (prepilin peptidase)/N-methyltransferase|nr:prepilin peptidase [Propionibacteriaceae bacterium]
MEYLPPALAAVLGIAVGWWQVRRLDTLSYRLAGEDGPAPSRRWVCVATAGAAFTIACAAPWQFWPAYAPLVFAGGWLAGVDRDVRRLPNKVMGPVALCTAVGIACSAALLGDWIRPLWALGAAALVFAIFAVGVARGGIGGGDAKLVAIFAAALGLRSPMLGMAAVMIGGVFMLVWALLIYKQRPFPYGPGLLLGAWVAALIPVS